MNRRRASALARPHEDDSSERAAGQLADDVAGGGDRQNLRSQRSGDLVVAWARANYRSMRRAAYHGNRIKNLNASFQRLRTIPWGDELLASDYENY